LAKIIPFKPKSPIDPHALLLLKIADDIDEVIINHLSEDNSARDIAGVLAHRLGTLMRQVTAKDREILWHVVQKVLKEQAELDKAE
jgi:hypothetical protein